MKMVKYHTSVSYGGGFVNNIKNAILDVFVHLLKNYQHFYVSKVYIFQKQRKQIFAN